MNNHSVSKIGMYYKDTDVHDSGFQNLRWWTPVSLNFLDANKVNPASKLHFLSLYTKYQFFPILQNKDAGKHDALKVSLSEKVQK